jgi:hypothetical protein
MRLGFRLNISQTPDAGFAARGIVSCGASLRCQDQLRRDNSQGGEGLCPRLPSIDRRTLAALKIPACSLQKAKRPTTWVRSSGAVGFRLRFAVAGPENFVLRCRFREESLSLPRRVAQSRDVRLGCFGFALSWLPLASLRCRIHSGSIYHVRLIVGGRIGRVGSISPSMIIYGPNSKSDTK